MALTACKGSNDNDSKATSNSTGTLKFDGRSAYRLFFRDMEKDDLVLSFVQQDEVRSMELDRLNVGTATDLSETDYFPRFVVRVQSGSIECISGPIPFSDSMQLECKDSSNKTEEDRTAGGANTPSSEIGSCATGNNPSTIQGAKYNVERTDGELRLVFQNDLTNEPNPTLRSPYMKFEGEPGIYRENLVVGGIAKVGSLSVQKSEDDYIVIFGDTNTSYKIGTFSKTQDIISGNGKDAIYRVKFESNVCMATFKSSDGSLSGGAGYLVIGK
jgi:hypothetical protein